MDRRERVAVTGAAGFIGSNLCRALLSEGYAVVAIDDLSAGTFENLPDRVDFRKIDICDEKVGDHFEGVSAIFHMAAKNCLPDCAASPVETQRINVLGTARVVEAAVQRRVPHLIYSDTSAEYEGIEEFPSRVDRIQPLSVYACSKRGGALAARALAYLHGISVSTVRYFNVYGRAQDWRRVVPPVMSAFTIKLLTGEPPTIYGSGDKRRDFIHVDDVNSFHLKLLREKNLWGGTYNLGSGKDYSIREIFDEIEGILRTGIPPRFAPDLPAEAFRTLADVSGTEATGWSARVSLREGLQDFIEYTRDRLANSKSK